MTSQTTGQLLGRYELLVPVGYGGMAQVWAARLRGTYGFQRIVAIKTILPGVISARMQQMFLEEAAIASQIHHPNVVETLDLGEEGGTLYLVMDWVEGESLDFIRARVAQGDRIPLPMAVNLVGQICKGLHAAHELRDEAGVPLGVVHRDVSAPNVLVTFNGTAKLVDFGIAKVTNRQSNLTRAGEIKGKFAYLSPEQIQELPVDRRADIFGMGVILYLLTTGRHPFRAESPTQTLENICSKAPPVAPSYIATGYPSALEAIVLKALSKSPDDRWATAYDMLTALEEVMPEALEGSFELEVAAYMNRVLGPWLVERRAQLVLAQQLADRSRQDGAPPDSSRRSSVTSLRPISVDAQGENASSQLLFTEELEKGATGGMRREAHSPSRREIWTGGAIATGGLLVLLTQMGRSGSTPIEPDVVAAGRAYGAPMSAAVSEPFAPYVGANVRAPEPIRSECVPFESGDPASHVVKPSRTPAAAPLQAAATASATGTPASATYAPSSERTPAGGREKKLDAWDTDNFGGRR